MSTVPLSRRQALVILFSLTALQLTRGQAPSVDFTADVEFLLTELERQAGHFFKTKAIDWKTVAERFRA